MQVHSGVDTASKTGTDNDAIAVTYFACDRLSATRPLCILDRDIVQIEGFSIGDQRSHREDGLLDTFCCGIALALGNGKGL